MAGSENLVQHTAGHFGFSAVGLTDLGATKYTLVQLILDRSGSTTGFQDKMEKVLEEIVKGCMKCPQANNLMLRVVVFEDHHEELHGFKLLASCNPGDYKGTLNPGGATALSDAVVDGVDAVANYGKYLMPLNRPQSRNAWNPSCRPWLALISLTFRRRRNWKRFILRRDSINTSIWKMLARSPLLDCGIGLANRLVPLPRLCSRGLLRFPLLSSSG